MFPDGYKFQCLATPSPGDVCPGMDKAVKKANFFI